MTSEWPSAEKAQHKWMEMYPRTAITTQKRYCRRRSWWWWCSHHTSFDCNSGISFPTLTFGFIPEVVAGTFFSAAKVLYVHSHWNITRIGRFYLNFITMLHLGNMLPLKGVGGDVSGVVKFSPVVESITLITFPIQIDGDETSQTIVFQRLRRKLSNKTLVRIFYIFTHQTPPLYANDCLHFFSKSGIRII